jgi:hypothetical protein
LLSVAPVAERCARGAAQISGAIRDDRQALRLNELELLFSVRTRRCTSFSCSFDSHALTLRLSRISQ